MRDMRGPGMFKAVHNDGRTSMTHTPHELTDEFPEQAALIHKLREENSHFAKLSDNYHEINREIHRGETDVEPMDDVRLEDLKKQRLVLLDEITGFLQ